MKQKAKGAIDLMEEAVQLLRVAPARTLISYFIGTLPFVLGLLYFLADMSKSPFAGSHLGQSAFGLTLLFIWMKAWQSVFVTQLKAQITGSTPPVFSPGRIWKIVTVQTLHQPIGLFIIPLSLFFCAFGWAYAYYQNLLISGNGDPSFATPAKTAWSQAKLWQGQNHMMLGIVSLLWFFMFINMALLILVVPTLMNTLFGIETAFTRSGLGVFNTTYFAIVFGVTHVCLDPFIKAFYVLRCFYGEAIESAADLKSDLRSILPRSVAVMLILLSLFEVFPVSAQTKNVPAQQLDHSIQDEISKREYQWRLPRQHEDSEVEKGMVAQFLNGILNWTQERLVSLYRLYRRFRQWLHDRFQSEQPGHQFQNGPSPGQERMLLWGLSAVAVLLLLFFTWRIWLERRKKPAEIHAEAVNIVPDLKDENLIASELPEEGWQAMARDLLARGEYRLALRALYMSTLAHLGTSGLITIAKYKSNMEYQRELHRRSRERETMLQTFGENLRIFERSWYGNHEVTNEIVQLFNSNHARILQAVN
jgi:hypothetical protein